MTVIDAVASAIQRDAFLAVITGECAIDGLADYDGKIGRPGWPFASSDRERNHATF